MGVAGVCALSAHTVKGEMGAGVKGVFGTPIPYADSLQAP